MSEIHLWGVKQNNLKDIEVKIPLGSFTVVCGPSGSGKSSLAFETLYAEGQRRYIESLSNYTKQFLNKAPKPDLEGVENIPPALALEQKNSVKSSRSTIGTVTEVVDYLRLLYEKVGKAYCPHHHVELQKDSPSSGADKVLSVFANDRGYVLCPISSTGRVLKGRQLLESLLQDGFLRIYLPASEQSKTASQKKKAKTKKKRTTSTKKALAEAKKSDAKWEIFSTHLPGEVISLEDLKSKRRAVPTKDFWLVIDRMAFRKEDRGRLVDSLSQAYQISLKYNKDIITAQASVSTVDGKRLLINEDFSCSLCDYRLPEITARLFSFNSPVGACSHCNGFGNVLEIDEDKVIPNPELTIAQGAIKPFAMPSAKSDRRALMSFCKKAKIDTHMPWKDLPEKKQKMIWEGTETFYGVVGLFEYLESKKYKMHVRVFLARHKSPSPCPVCKGTRLKPEAQQVLIDGSSITDLSALSIETLLPRLKKLPLSPSQKEISSEILDQMTSRLQFLCQVGVGYLTLDRPTKTLSGGEYQRLSLSNQLGMGLSQTLYVLDEPTVGLHPRDNDRLIEVLKELRERGNTLVVVEHDHDVIRNSSHLIEMGPGSGYLGGQIIFSGPSKDFYKAPQSNTNMYFKAGPHWQLRQETRPVDMNNYRYILGIYGCDGHNLKKTDLRIPLHRLVTVTGVSGSGKSSLISQTLYPALARSLGVEYKKGLPYESLEGHEHVKGLLFLDQSPIGKTARSNLMTYLKVYDAIRTVMASTSEARLNGYSAGTFSLNVDGGRCPVCKGLGYEVVDMMFMDDIHIPCEACDGKKFRPEILDVTYKNKNIYDIMEMTVAEAMNFFVNHPNIRRPLSILTEVGLDYLRLGQSASSLSGGESQRLKLAREFNSTSQRGTLYILDEPTTGLHFREVHLLLKVLHRLVDAGGSVVLIEHNLEMIRDSDYIIDLGPEAGSKGGKVVAQGTPGQLVNSKKGYTGRYLKDYIESLLPSRPYSTKDGYEAGC